MKTNRIYSFLGILFGLLFVFNGNVWGTDAEWDWSTDNLSSTTKGQITMSYGDGGASTSTTVSGTPSTLRLYSNKTTGHGGWIKFTAASGYQITSVSVTAAENQSKARYGVDAANVNTAVTSSFSYSSGSATVSNLTASTFTIKNGHTGANTATLRFSSITVTYSSTCDKSVTVSIGSSSTNGSISTITGSPVATCDASASNRTVTITVSPNTGYVAPTNLSFSVTSGSAVTATKESGPTNNVYVYSFAQNDNNSTCKVNVACVGKQCTLIFDQNGGTGGQTSNLTATYGSAMPAISGVPTRTHYDFEGYYDGEGGTGNKYYNSDGTSATNWNKNTTANTTLYAKWTEHRLKNYRTSCCTAPGTALSITSANSVATGGTVNLTSTGGNGGTVTWSVVNGTGTASVAGTTLTAGSVGTVTVKAHQDATGSYCAQDAEQAFTVVSATVNVTGVEVSPTTKAIVPGETFTITATVAPADATDKSVSWTSSASDKASVSSGTVTGVAAGTATITCTTTDGSYTATTAVTVYGVTMQALDEDGNAIAVGGPGTPSRTGASISPAADAGNYVFKEWAISGASLGSSASTKANTITNPTGAVTVTAKYYKPRVVKWSVDGDDSYEEGTPTLTVAYNSAISAVPDAPDDDALNNCANKFMGWSTKSWGSTTGKDDSDYDDLFTTADGYTTGITDATKTFYAVFAEEGGSGTYSDGTTHVWLTGPTYTYEDWGGTSTYSWPRNDNAELPTFKYTPIYGVKKVVLNVKQTQTAGSNTVAVSVGGTTIGSTQTIGSESGTSAFDMTFDNGTGTPLTGQVQIVLTNTSGSGTGKGSFYLNSITLHEGVQDIGYTNYVTQCADDQVRVTYDFNGGTGDDCTEGVTEKTANYTVCSTEPEKDYYTFAGWNDGTSTYSAGATGYNLQTNTTFTAQWTATSYDITYVLDGGTNDGDNPATYTVETSDITLKDATKGHSRFDGWFTDNSVWSEEVTTISNGSHGNITLYAKWTDRNEIKFYADASLLATIYRASDENLQASVTGQGSKPSDPSAPSACSSKVFKGWTETWFNDETDTEPADLNDATGTRSADKTYYAVWATQSGSLGSYTYSAYSTTCCANEVTVSGGSPSNGSVTFDKSYVWTCKGEREIEMTIDPTDGYQLATFSVATGDGKVAAKSMSADVELNNNSSEPQEITLTFAQDADGAYDVTATFAEMTVTSWEWTYNSSALPDPIDVYVGQKKQIDVVMSPSGVLSSHKNNNSYTHSVNATYIANPNRAGAYFTFEGKAATESTPITLTHNDDTSEPKAFALTFNVRVKALPLVHFVDNIHNESFSDVVATVSGDKMTVNMVQSTPTHADVAEPGTGNSCEKTHLHLVGWIRSDYSKVAAYMAGTGDAPTTEELSGAGSDYWFLPDADINVETFNGKTFYAVWAVEE